MQVGETGEVFTVKSYALPLRGSLFLCLQTNLFGIVVLLIGLEHYTLILIGLLGLNCDPKKKFGNGWMFFDYHLNQT